MTAHWVSSSGSLVGWSSSPSFGLLITAIVPVGPPPERHPRSQDAPSDPRRAAPSFMRLAPPSLRNPDENPLEETRRPPSKGRDAHDFVVATAYKAQAVRSIAPPRASRAGNMTGKRDAPASQSHRLIAPDQRPFPRRMRRLWHISATTMPPRIPPSAYMPCSTAAKKPPALSPYDSRQFHAERSLGHVGDHFSSRERYRPPPRSVRDWAQPLLDDGRDRVCATSSRCSPSLPLAGWPSRITAT